MIIYKHNCKLNQKEKKEVLGLVNEITDVYGDFYLTKNNLRLFLKENSELIFESIEKGDYIAFDEKGLVLVTGFSDNAKRKYLKVLTKSPDILSSYLKILSWDLDCDLYIKIKKNNPLKNVLLKNNFEFFGGRGKEILLKKTRRE